jgi:hypothetical protein
MLSLESKPIHTTNQPTLLQRNIQTSSSSREMIEGGPLTGPPPPLSNKKYKFIQKEKTKQSKSTLS